MIRVPGLLYLVAFAGMAAGLLATPQSSGWAQSPIALVSDDFEKTTLDLKIWNPLQIRPERYRVDQMFARSGRRALAISVVPPDVDCDGGCQRNEIRIADDLRLKFGRGAWYGFSFQVRGDTEPRTLRRWVIGQWKEETNGSPFLAQRYSGGIFHITAQDNDCRILIARAGSTASVFLNRLESRSYGDFPFVTDVRDYDCKPAVTVEHADDPILPDPHQAWVDMAYFVKGGRNGTGVIEVWANGRFIARVTGSIGNDAVLGPSQYFKIGMYRDPMAGSSTLYFDNFRRGPTRKSVEPHNGEPQ